MKIQKVVGCFIENDGKILIGKRRPDKSEGNTRGIPAGKIEIGETKEDACIRETFEEVGITINKNNLEFIGEYPFDFPDKKVIFFTFRLKLDHNIKISLNDGEFTEYKWITPEDCYKMNDLIFGGHKLLILTGYVSDK